VVREDVVLFAMGAIRTSQPTVEQYGHPRCHNGGEDAFTRNKPVNQIMHDFGHHNKFSNPSAVEKLRSVFSWRESLRINSVALLLSVCLITYGGYSLIAGE
jgi:hypothetical protein